MYKSHFYLSKRSSLIQFLIPYTPNICNNITNTPLKTKVYKFYYELFYLQLKLEI